MIATVPGAPSLAEIRSAAKLLAPHILRTPLVPLNVDRQPGKIFLKLENLQRTGAFKARPMGNAMLAEKKSAMRRGVYTASSGNAGLGLAWIARILGVAATVYAPHTAPPDKLAAIRRYDAQIVCLPDVDWWHIIESGGHPKDPGLYIDAVRNPSAMAGNGTIGLEIVEQIPDVANVILPFGGGGLTCGVASAIRAVKPDTRIIVAESDAATPLTAALQAGHPVSVTLKSSFISGAGAASVLHEMWPLVRQLVDASIVTPVAQVADAVGMLFERNKIVAEGAGAIAVAAAIADENITGKTVCVVSGGNIDLTVMAETLKPG